MIDWQRVVLSVCAMATPLICRMSASCAQNSSVVDYLACVIVGAIFGSHVPSVLGKVVQSVVASQEKNKE